MSTVARLCCCLLLSLPSVVLAAQDGSALLHAREQVQRVRDSEGPMAPQLLELLGDLGRHASASGRHEEAAAAYAELRHLLRTAHGLDTLAELEPLRQQVLAVAALGRRAEAWELEQGLIQLAGRHLGAAATLPVYRGLADSRLELLQRYERGESPEEIVLGCYYGQTEFIDTLVIRDAMLNATPRRHERCDSGYRSTVQSALLLEARNYQVLALEALLQNRAYADPLLQTQVQELIRTSLRLQALLPQYRDPVLTRVLQRALAFTPEDAPSRVSHALLLVQVADFNVIRAHRTRRFGRIGVVLAQYEEAWAALAAAGWSAAQLDAVFRPAVPVVLPAGDSNPFAGTVDDEAAWIDIAWEIDKRGEAQHIQVDAMSPAATQAQQRALRELVQRSIFRPRLESGKAGTASRVRVRYNKDSMSATVSSQ